MSHHQIKELQHELAELGSDASSHYARGLCFMPHLQSLSLGSIEELVHKKAYLGSAASSHCARGLCSMPHLRSLILNSMELSDKFYSTMADEASKSKIEKLRHFDADLGSAASSDYARGLCFMPHLQSLELYRVELSYEFYSTMADEASNSKIEKLTHSEADLGSAASSHYARGLCSMPHLRSLRLDIVELSDEFYSTMASEASKSKIEELNHREADLGSAASSHYARGLCFMPHLRSLCLYSVELSDEFYLTMASKASKSKIQTLSVKDVSMMTPRRLLSILSLPRLQSLTLRDIRQVDIDDGETLTRPTSVDELTVDGKHVISLWNLGLHTSCPRVKKLKLSYQKEENVSSDIITMACTPFYHLTHLQIKGDKYRSSTTLNDPVSFCDAVKTSCPQLTKLSFMWIKLKNEKAAEVIQLMKTHPHLTSIELRRCPTNTGLDPLVSEVNSEGKLTVTVEHTWR
ncbi:uncharacterized protein LOC115921422 [Strongylocentrotus purpuratus]|uniref:Uncharacterized protein n=1 Tax=Strongylocentrotus purpuratus TaxID=7668 RepID=A0A7M7ND72_STRPU|nr:uncharacterized protein LOC115921422 [Strongylocentrotus purpuratus]